MAALSVRVNILRVIAICGALSCAGPGGISMAAGAETKKPKTEASAEVFDVKEKDLPVVGSAPSASSKAPAPDLKEFGDEKFINNLLDGGAKPATGETSANADKTKTPSKAPEAQGKPADSAAQVKPDAIIDDLLGGQVPEKTGDVPPKTTATETKNEGLPTTAITPENSAAQPQTSKANDTNSGAPTATNTGDVGQVPPGADAQTLANKATADGGNNNLQNAPALTEEEKATYSNLKQHLVNFISSFQSVASNQGEKPPEPVKEAEVKELPAKPAGTATDTTEPAQVAVVPQAGATAQTNTTPVTVPAGQPTEIPKTNLPNEFDDFLEPTEKVAKAEKTEDKNVAEKGNPATDKAIDASSVEKPDQAKPEPAKTTAVADAKPVANLVKPIESASTPTKGNTTDKVLPLEKPKEVVNTAQVPEKPVAKEKLSDADKAYFKLLDKKREELPEDKRLSKASKGAMDEISTTIAPIKKPSKKETEYIKVERGTKAVPAIEEGGVIKSQTKMDLVIRKSDKNEDYEKSKVKLEKAYKALLVGQIAAAISVYKDVLVKEPDNKDAMFGLATAYHKNSQYDQAREIYTKLLKKDPSNKEALNNFLVLVAEEAPEDALIELEKLERINSDFSPIPAQIAMINLKLGNAEKAARYLRRAILLSPENVSYKYNLAITYDKLGKEEQAVQLYHQIISEVRSGAVIPGSIDKLVERVSYLETKISNKK